MLQIASGMYFRPGVPLFETLHRFTVYTNASRIDKAPVELPIASLRFSTRFEPFVPVTIEVWDRLEAERPNGEPEFMIATSGQDLIADVTAVLSFATNTTWSIDRDLVRRLVQSAPSDRPRQGPASQLRRTFDSQVGLSDFDIADAAAFSTRLLALRRAEYEKVILAIRRVVDATLLIADDVTLAYTLFVAALESLAANTEAPAVAWDAFDGRKRMLIDAALTDLSEEQAQRVREAVLQADSLGAGRKFQSFVLDHVEPSFFRAEAIDVRRPIRADELPLALNFAYQVRSRQVHALQRLAPEIWAIADRADAIPVGGRQVFSLEGLNRLCRHVIRAYVKRAPTDHDADFDYRRALPGIVNVPFAPQYWIGQAEGLRAESFPVVLNGFLEVLLPVLRGDEPAIPVDMRKVCERIEVLLRGEASQAKRAPMIALYALWHRLLPEEYHRPSSGRILDRFEHDLEPLSAASFAARLLITAEAPWQVDQFVAFADSYREALRRGKAQPLPARLYATMELCLARQLVGAGREGEAVIAVARAVETLPGDQSLIELEERVHAAGPAELATLDGAAFLLRSGEDEVLASDEGSTDTG